MSINKQELYLNCLDLLNERIEKYSTSLKSAQDSKSSEEMGNNYEEQIGTGEVLGDVESVSEQLDNARKMKQDLVGIDPNMRNDFIGMGSVVETDKNYYFISVPLGKIHMEDGSSAYTISLDAPLYQELEGKTSGDSFVFKGETINIINLW